MFLTVSILFWSPLTWAQSQANAAGHWEGSINLPGRELVIAVDLERDQDGTWSATMDLPAQGFQYFPLMDVTVEGSTISFAMAAVPGVPVFKGALSEDGQTLSGNMSQAGQTFPFKLARTAVAKMEAPATSAPKDPPTSGFRAAFLGEFEHAEKQLVQLAEAFPEEKYSWRPSEGVRSVSEVYMHIAGANFVLPTFLSVKAPKGTHLGLEKTVTQKAQVIELLKQSFSHARQVALSTADADLDKAVKLWGRPSSVSGVFLRLSNHANEHMGQLIAYARVNHITPPWSEGGAGAPPRSSSAASSPTPDKGVPGEGLEGVWSGALNAGGTNLRLVLKVSKASDGTLTAKLDSPDQGATDLPVDSVTLQNTSLRFEMKQIGGLYEGTMNQDGSEIVGQWQQGGLSLPLTFKRQAPEHRH
jgi:uncharacterized damage-inducible protein DinB